MLRKTITFLIIYCLLILLVQSVEVNTGIAVENVAISEVKISDFFSRNGGWTDYDNMPRMICDLDGNGSNDIVGFKDNKVHVSFNDGTTFADPIEVSSDFGSSDGYSTQDITPRFCGDVDGDGMADIAGIKSDGVYVAFSNGQSNLSSPERLSLEFGSDDGWLNFNSEPKYLADVDGDGMADLVGINNLGIYIAFSNGKNHLGQGNNFENKAFFGQRFDRGLAGWVSQTSYVRYIGSLDNSNNLLDFIGFGGGVQAVYFTDRTTSMYDSFQYISNEYPQSSYPDFNLKPRMIGDLNGDGMSDLIAFDDDRIRYSILNNSVEELKRNYADPNVFVRNGGTYTNYNDYPRFIANILGDNRDDIIGFSDDGVYALITEESCSDNNSRDNTNNCACKDGFREDPSAANGPCIPCVYPCQRCENNDTTCLECVDNSDIANRNAVSDCHCKNGYYKNGSNECIECDLGCELCTNQGNECSSCIDGYFHTGPSTCTICKLGCKLCSVSADNCSECISTLNRSSTAPGDCACLDRYYQDPSGDECLQCKNKYFKCLGENVADECQGQFRENEDLDCVCQRGYFEILADNQTDCTKCSDHCGSCSQLGSCIDCVNSDSNRNMSTCECNPGYFINGSNCTKCDDGCATCTSSGSCTVSCSSVCEICLPNVDCIQVPDGYYINPITKQPGQCDHSQCATCLNSASNCIDTCQIGCDQCNPSNVCQLAKDGYYLDSSTQNPIKCADGCATCSESGSCDIQCPNNCEICQPNQDCTKVPDGYYIYPITKRPGKCDDSQCSTCENSAENCIVFCKQGCAQCDSSNTCLVPEDGFYNDIDSGKPEKCSRLCTTCEDSASNCLISCGAECGLCKGDGSCETCKIGTFQKDLGVCENCHPKCYSCTEKNTCISCSGKGEGRSNNIDENCSCKEGYYENGDYLDCLQCPQGCKRCDNSGICLECGNSKLNPPLCQVISFDLAVVQNPVDGNSATKCEIQCEICETTPGNCTQCSKGRNRNNDSSCLCKEGYHDNDGTSADCIRCSEGCQKCKNEFECIECSQESKKMLNSFSRQCECQQNQKEVNGICMECYKYMNKCIEKCPQNTIKNEEFMICEKVSYLQKSFSGIFYISGGLILLFILFQFAIGPAASSYKKAIVQKNNSIVNQN